MTKDKINMTRALFSTKYNPDFIKSSIHPLESEFECDLTLLLNQHLQDFLEWVNTRWTNNIEIPNSEIGKFNLHKTNQQ